MAYYAFPHTEVNIYDQSQITVQRASVSDGTRMLFIFQSPRGEDGKLTAVKTVDELVSKFGMGDIKSYGQPLMNCRRALSTGVVTANCLRIAAPDATRANMYVYAAYKMVDVDSTQVLSVRFYTASELKVMDDEEPSTVTEKGMIDIKTLGQKAEELRPEPPEGYTIVYLMAIASKGRGAYGNNLGIRISNNSRADRENDYKNYYIQVYENDSMIEEIPISFYDNALTDTATLFADSVVNDPDTGSANIQIVTNPEGFEEIANAYNTNVFSKLTDPELETYAASIGMSNLKDNSDDPWNVLKSYMKLDASNFDYFLGINKNLQSKVTVANRSAIYRYQVEPSGSAENVVALTDLTGVDMQGGTDGMFEVAADGSNASDVTQAINDAYMYAFDPDEIPLETKEEYSSKGFVASVDKTIYSKTRHPLDLILDANYDYPIKNAIASLCTRRGDCLAGFDLCTGMQTSEDILIRLSYLDAATANRNCFVDGYEMKIRDPISRKIVSVTSTYWLSGAYPTNFDQNNGKHIPLAGGSYGTIEMDELVTNSIFPIHDEAIDAAIMDQLATYRVNYAQINPKSVMIRAMQSTRQDILSALSECNNMFILMDIKRDCETLCGNYSYNFLETTDLSRFNRDAEQLLTKYAQAQVRSITATFSSTDAEQEQGILHLTIELSHKRLIKTAIVDIYVNK